MIRLAVRPVVLFTLVSLAALRAPAHAQGPLQPAAAPAAANIRVDPLLAPLVDALLRQSPTLRRQWQTIGAAPLLRVSLVSTPLLRETPSARARTGITRFAFGAIHAIVELPAAVDITELLPHELEHVLEQLEGLNLAELSRRSSSGVDEIGRGVYETRRAREAGFAALREVYGRTDPAFGAALRGVQRAVKALLPDGRAAAQAALPAARVPAGPAGAPAPAASPPHKQQ